MITDDFKAQDSYQTLPCSTAIVCNTYSSTISAVSDSLFTNIPIISIPGIEYIPQENSTVLIIPTDREVVCSGCIIQNNPSLLPGELSFSSSGGATIKLCNDGSIILNGAIISSNGIFTPLKKEESL